MTLQYIYSISGDQRMKRTRKMKAGELKALVKEAVAGERFDAIRAEIKNKAIRSLKKRFGSNIPFPDVVEVLDDAINAIANDQQAKKEQAWQAVHDEYSEEEQRTVGVGKDRKPVGGPYNERLEANDLRAMVREEIRHYQRTKLYEGLIDVIKSKWSAHKSAKNDRAQGVEDRKVYNSKEFKEAKKIFDDLKWKHTAWRGKPWLDDNEGHNRIRDLSKAIAEYSKQIGTHMPRGEKWNPSHVGESVPYHTIQGAEHETLADAMLYMVQLVAGEDEESKKKEAEWNSPTGRKERKLAVKNKQRAHDKAAQKDRERESRNKGGADFWGY